MATVPSAVPSSPLAALTGYIAIQFTVGRTDSGWQKVKNGEVIDILDATGASVDMTAVREYHVSNGGALESAPGFPAVV